MLILATAVGIFAGEKTFTAKSTSGDLICTYQILEEPEGEMPGTVALIRCEKNPEVVDPPGNSGYWMLDLRGEIISPNDRAKYTVVQIGDGTNPIYPEGGELNRIREIGLPDALESIEANAFHDFVRMESIAGLAENENVKIAEGAFYGCFYLEGEDLPEIDAINNPNPFGNTVIEDFLELRGYYHYASSHYSEVGVHVYLPVEEYGYTFYDRGVERLFAGHKQKLVLMMNSIDSATSHY